MDDVCGHQSHHSQSTQYLPKHHRHRPRLRERKRNNNISIIKHFNSFFGCFIGIIIPSALLLSLLILIPPVNSAIPDITTTTAAAATATATTTATTAKTSTIIDNSYTRKDSNNKMATLGKVNVLMVGTGEYTTGYVGGQAADSDKGAGVVALTMFDLRRRAKVERVGMCGVNGKKFPGIRAHMQRCIGDVYSGMDLTCDTFPSDEQIDPKAYEDAVKTFKAGDVAVIFTPDDTHFTIALECINHGMHVMVTKPIVQTLEHHHALAKAAAEKGVLVAVEVHKRLDPFYADARDRARSGLGNFQYMYAYMSQPKHQLETFKAWAGKSSDISYYLNSHHVDWSEWTLANIARPIRVTATGSTGVAKGKGIDTEDSITLTVQWQNINDKTLGCAVYTSSWVAPKSDVHSQQRFFYMGASGEINVDQAHRGCTVATDQGGFGSVNPLFMKYTPTNGMFSGQGSYGVRSFENFIDACREINSGEKKASDYDDGSLATVHTTMQGTAILEAGRKSLDNDGRPFDILYDGDSTEPSGIEPHKFS